LSKKYKQAKEGKWIQPVQKGYGLCCCDCGLIHKIDFRIKGKKVQFRAYRDNKATKKQRHKQRIKLRTRYGKD